MDFKNATHFVANASILSEFSRVWSHCSENQLWGFWAAIREAAENLNYCPICKRLVCNRCFLICDDLDMCKQCAAQLEETGTPVLTDVLEAAI